MCFCSNNIFCKQCENLNTYPGRIKVNEGVSSHEQFWAHYKSVSEGRTTAGFLSSNVE
jgi:hypothetical protein